jgi:phosphoribosylpyrophosphate synthetase
MKMKFNIPDDRGKLYEVIKYPAGEIQTRLTANGIAAVLKDGVDAYEIVANPIPDVIELAQLNDAIQYTAFKTKGRLFRERSLFLPYLPYARADRRFVDGDSHGFGIFMKFIEALEFTSVWTFDAHNAGLARAYGIVNVLPTYEPTDQLLPIIQDMGKKSLVLVLPDVGAAKRYDLSKYKLPVLVAGKIRDAATGKLTGFKIGSGIKYYKSALIIDDICDGGGTFVGLGQLIKKKNPNIKLALYVSHGIFSKGTQVLAADGGITELYISGYSIKGQEYDTFNEVRDGRLHRLQRRSMVGRYEPDFPHRLLQVRTR